MIYLHIDGAKWPNCQKFDSFSLHVPKITLVYLGLKKHSHLLIVDSKFQISWFVKFFSKKLKFFKKNIFFEILAYESPNRILILKNFDDFFFWFFPFFLEKFWMIPNDKYTWEGQILILSFITYFLQMKSTIKLNFSKFLLWWNINLMSSP